jgi:hypothetical protein
MDTLATRSEAKQSKASLLRPDSEYYCFYLTRMFVRPCESYDSQAIIRYSTVKEELAWLSGPSSR